MGPAGRRRTLSRVKPLTRIALVGAPIAIAVSVYFGGGGEPQRPKDDPSLRISRTTAPNPLKAGSPGEQQELDDRIDAMPAGLAAPAKKELAAKLVTSAENSTLDWRGQLLREGHERHGEGGHDH